MQYSDIGHTDKKFNQQEIIWIVDENWNFQSYPITPETQRDAHFDFFGKMYYDSIASGRFILDLAGKKKTSLIINTYQGDLHPRRLEKIKEKVHKILDIQFDNPVIYEF